MLLVSFILAVLLFRKHQIDHLPSLGPPKPPSFPEPYQATSDFPRPSLASCSNVCNSQEYLVLYSISVCLPPISPPHFYLFYSSNETTPSFLFHQDENLSWLMEQSTFSPPSSFSSLLFAGHLLPLDASKYSHDRYTIMT